MASYFIHFVIGFLMAFIGLLSPGLLTMTTLSVAVNRGKRKALLFAVGVVFPIIIQAHLALLGAEYLKNHPEIIKSFSKIAVFVFFAMAFVFYRQYKQRNALSQRKYNIRNSFLYGVFISTINPLAIPFYFTYSTLLEMQDILVLQQPMVSIFVGGAVLGAFTILYIYGRNAVALFNKIQFLAKNFKLLMAVGMFILGLASLYNSLR
jgi:threonine/homoserine/homoserine lactone efflux protein